MTKMPLKRQADAILPTRWGKFKMVAYAQRSDDPLPHLAMIHENFMVEQSPTLVRVHSECMTGDVFHSHRCDCGEQLDHAMRLAAERGGVVIYLRQEGRSIGLINKLKAYQLQDEGLNTAEANLKLGFKADGRTYEDAKVILDDLGIQKIILLTNNPLKINYLEKEGIEVVARESIIIEPREENEFYLHTKRDLMGHLF
jgi:GTP cyclohydrolase II